MYYPSIRIVRLKKPGDISYRKHELGNGFFLILIVGGGVQLGPLCTSVTNWPILPAPGEYEDGEFGGMMLGRKNRSTRRKPTPVPLFPPQIPQHLTGREPGSQRCEASD
jgi:hypothetical protein